MGHTCEESNPARSERRNQMTGALGEGQMGNGPKKRGSCGLEGRAAACKGRSMKARANQATGRKLSKQPIQQCKLRHRCLVPAYAAPTGQNGRDQASILFAGSQLAGCQSSANGSLKIRKSRMTPMPAGREGQTAPCAAHVSNSRKIAPPKHVQFAGAVQTASCGATATGEGCAH